MAEIYQIVWDVSGGYLSDDDEEIVGTFGVDGDGFLHVLDAETDEIFSALDDVCERANAKTSFHVRKPSSDGSVFTSEVFLYKRDSDGFIDALIHHLEFIEFLNLYEVQKI